MIWILIVLASSLNNVDLTDNLNPLPDVPPIHVEVETAIEYFGVTNCPVIAKEQTCLNVSSDLVDIDDETIKTIFCFVDPNDPLKYKFVCTDNVGYRKWKEKQ